MEPGDITGFVCIRDQRMNMKVITDCLQGAESDRIQCFREEINFKIRLGELLYCYIILGRFISW